MADYSADILFVLWILTSSGGELIVRLGFALLAWLFLFACGLWLPLLLLKPSRADSESEPLDSPGRGETGRSDRLALVLSLGTGGGLIATVLFWTVSFYIFNDTASGTWGLVALAAVSLLSAGRLRRHANGLLRGPHLVVVTLIAFVMAVWHIGVTEMPHESHIWFCDRHKDLAGHVYMAALVRDSGLPLVDLNGSVYGQYANLTHTGLSVLIAGLSDVTGRSLYQTAQFLWIIGYATIAWSSLTLVSRFRLSTDFAVLAGVAPLFWASSVHLPIELLRGNFEGVIDPKRSAALPFGVASGAMYHNATLLCSVAVVAVALVCIDRFSARGNTLALCMGALAIVVSGWIKPSLAVLFGPALLVYLLLRNSSADQLLSAALILICGVAVYLLPEFLVRVSRGVRWNLQSFNWDVVETTLLGAGLLGATMLAVLDRLRLMLKDRRRLRELGWADLTLIAAGGGVVFAAFFREADREHGNHMWGLCGCAMLLAAWAVAWWLDDAKSPDAAALSAVATKIAQFTRSLFRKAIALAGRFGGAAAEPQTGVRSPQIKTESRKPKADGRGCHGFPPSASRVVSTDGLRWAAVALIGIQLLSGAIYAAWYPTLELTAVAKERVAALVAAGKATPPGTRFLIDKVLSEPHLVSYVGHPVLRIHRVQRGDVNTDPRLWRELLNEGKLTNDAFISKRDAVLIHTSRAEIREILGDLGFVKQVDTPGHFEVWINPRSRKSPGGR